MFLGTVVRTGFRRGFLGLWYARICVAAKLLFRAIESAQLMHGTDGKELVEVEAHFEQGAGGLCFWGVGLLRRQTVWDGGMGKAFPMLYFRSGLLACLSGW